MKEVVYFVSILWALYTVNGTEQPLALAYAMLTWVAFNIICLIVMLGWSIAQAWRSE